MSRSNKKHKRKVLLLTIIIIPLFTLLVSNMFSYWSQIYKNKKEKIQLKEQYANKLEEEEKLNKEITKLNDPEYIAKYAREKYMYSKNGEIIIRIDEEDKGN